MESFTTDEIAGPFNDVEQKHAPSTLWVEGDLSLLRREPRVAVVGSRKCSDDGRRRAAKLARFLVDQGAVVVSGLAEGVDTVAHTTAMQRGGRTIAVVGTGLDSVYPSANAALQARIGREHLLLSQFAPGTPIQRRQFPQRNRTMALLSHATVIIEAGESSGTISQAWEAIRLGRPLFILRSVAENPRLTWPRELLNYGAEVLSDPEQLLPVLPSVSADAKQAVSF